jgi:Aldos-2-ulose dehydratase/isomerase (AUDH) Cupin domain
MTTAASVPLNDFLSSPSPHFQTASLGKTGVEVKFNEPLPSCSGALRFGPSGWSMRLCALGPGNAVSLPQRRDSKVRFFAKVIQGELDVVGKDAHSKQTRRNVPQERFAPCETELPAGVAALRSAGVASCVFALFELDNNNDEEGDTSSYRGRIVRSVRDAAVSLAPVADAGAASAVEEALRWVNCDTYGWGPHFDGLDFFNSRGIHVLGPEGAAPLCHIQFWLAGVGTDCGTHDHADLTGDDAFCEVHLSLSNGTGRGGMAYFDEASGEDHYLPLQVGQEHGPFWEFDSRSGRARRRPDGSVIYPRHRWEAGTVLGSGTEHQVDGSSRLDFWVAFEFPPDAATLPTEAGQDGAGAQHEG